MPDDFAPVAPAIPAGTTAPNGAAPPPVSEREVANVLAGLVDRDDEQEQDTGSETPPADDAGDVDEDLGVDESQPTEEDDADMDEPAARPPAHDPPASWTAEAKAAWAKMPPIAQEQVAKREAELTAGYTRATQERAEVERMALARIEQDRTQYINNLAVFRNVLAPRAQQFDQVDWQRLAQENPADYVRLQAEAGAIRQQIGQVEQEVARVQQTQQYEQAQRTEIAKREGYRKLVEAIPEFADPQYAQRVGTELGQFLRGYGFSDQEIASCVDDRPLKLALALMQSEKSKQAVQSADRKRTPQPAPTVQRAGNSQGNGTSSESRSRRMTQLAAKFEASPTVQDAAKIVREWMR
jgi:hypothetical protein